MDCRRVFKEGEEEGEKDQQQQEQQLEPNRRRDEDV